MSNEEKYLPPIHPGEILDLEFMRPLRLSPNALGKALGVSPCQINKIINGKRTINADIANRLSRFFGTSAQFWLNLQSSYEIDNRYYKKVRATGSCDFLK